MPQRRPIVAGQFYPASKDQLSRVIKDYMQSSRKPIDAKGIVAPHAGYIYSGRVAGAVYACITVPQCCVIISPNHTGAGPAISIMTDGEWEIPTGNIPIHTPLALEIMKNSSLFQNDTTAHALEHSLEVQLPFLLERQPTLSIVPITVQYLNYSTTQSIGRAIAKSIRSLQMNVLIVASSDMTHYEPAERAREKDMLAIEYITALDPEGLLNICRRRNITMCGVVPTAIMICAAKELGASKAEMVKYATSGDTTGDSSSVVGYAAIVVY